MRRLDLKNLAEKEENFQKQIARIRATKFQESQLLSNNAKSKSSAAIKIQAITRGHIERKLLTTAFTESKVYSQFLCIHFCFYEALYKFKYTLLGSTHACCNSSAEFYPKISLS